MKVLVIGGTGFVGRRLVERLHAEAGNGTSAIEVVAGVRTSRPDFEKAGIEQRVFDATDPAAVAGALAGITHVVNAVMGSNAGMVAATRAITEAARPAGVTRLVHFSSIAVFGDTTGQVGEAKPFARQVDGYAQAKIDCEAIVTAARAGGLETVILRPALIYGPGSEPWTERIGRLVSAGRLGDLGAAGDGLCNLVYIDDVVSAAVAAIRRPGIDGAIVHLAMAEPPSWNRYLMDFAREIGAVPVNRIPQRQLKLEVKLIAIPLKLGQIALGKIGRRLPFSRFLWPDPITPGLARLFSQDVRYRTERLQQVLAIPETDYRDGLKRAAEWFLQKYRAGK